jgi:hypothetical protein
MMDSETVMLIGGEERSNKTFTSKIGDAFEWQEGPQTTGLHSFSGCSKIRIDGASLSETIIVAGDYSYHGGSVEILDAEGNRWRPGPAIPREVYASKIFRDPSGGVVLIITDDLGQAVWRLAHAKAQWEPLPNFTSLISISEPMLMIPDSLTNCTLGL